MIQKIALQTKSEKYFQIWFFPRFWGEKWWRSEHAHASYLGLFCLAPIYGAGKKGEFRNWTRIFHTRKKRHTIFKVASFLSVWVEATWINFLLVSLFLGTFQFLLIFRKYWRTTFSPSHLSPLLVIQHGAGIGSQKFWSRGFKRRITINNV